MRRIVCRFDDESDFLRQFRWQQSSSASADRAADFAFVGEFELQPHEQIRLTAMVSSNRDQCNLDMSVLDVVPMAIDAVDGSRVFRYRARVAPQDAVWLLAFRQKMSTMQWLEQLAA